MPGVSECLTRAANRKGVLFAGTGNGLFYSLDDGGHWTGIRDGLPPAPVSWVTVQKQFHDVVVSTYGRGFYILDDITPLEQMAQAPTETSVRFFTPRPAYRFLAGQKAFLNFDLKQAPKGQVQVTILDANSKTVRTMRADAKQGLNRQSWDLRYDPPQLVALRTTPPENPHIWEETRFRGADSRPITHWGAEPAQVGPIAAPGKYTARLTVDGEAYAQPLEILLDPKSTGTEKDIEAAVNMQLKIRDDINTVSGIVNRIEWMRKQLEDLSKLARSPQGKPELLKSVQDIDQKMQNVEYKLITRSLALSDDKYFIEAYNVYFNLIWLNGEVGTGAGDVHGGADYGPTDSEAAMLQSIEQELSTAQAEYKGLMEKEVPAFNRAIANFGATPITGSQ